MRKEWIESEKESIEGLIEDIQDRVKDGILEKEKGDLIIRLMEKAESAADARAIAQLGTTYKKTGYYWTPKLENAETGKDTSIYYLKKNTELSFSDGNKNRNKLIVGENYYALENLLVQYREKVDVIYIDPPYGSDSMGEFAETNYKNNIDRNHLLSMLWPRLRMAKDLLSSTGVIFLSIDDKNQAHVKLLMDEVFGEENFVACCPRKSAGSRTTKSLHELQVIHDYVLVYRHKNNEEFNQNIVGEKNYKYQDERGKYYTVPLQDNGPHGTRRARPNLYYPIYQNKDGALTLEETPIKYLPHEHKHEDGRWMWSKEKFLKDSKDLVIENGEVKIKHYYKDGEDTNKYAAYTSWLDKHQNAKGTALLSDIFSTKTFESPKPLELIKYLINLCSNKNCIVLDFFAGSGTTGQAVLDLNREDGGDRTFILCTNNENNIGHEVTAERLKRVMTGSSYAGDIDFQWAKKNTPYGGTLDVYDLDTVSAYEYSFGRSAFDVINEEDYGFKKMGLIDKAAWIRDNFDATFYADRYGKKEIEPEPEQQGVQNDL